MASFVLAGILLGLSLVARAAPERTVIEVAGHTGGAVRAVVADSSSTWVGEGIGVTRYDISVPEFARRESHFVIADDADVWSLARAGHHLYAGTTGGLYVMALSPSGAPSVIGHLATTGSVRGLAVYEPPGSGDRWLIVTDDRVGVQVVAVDGDGALTPVAALPDTAGALGPAVVDGTRVVVPATDGLVFDLTDPSAPTLVGRIETAGMVWGAAAAAGRAFLADSADGLLEVTLGGEPLVVARLPDVQAGLLRWHGGNLYVIERHTSGPNTVRLIDVAVPADPRDILGGESTYAVLRGTQDLTVTGRTLVSARGDGLVLADVTDRNWPEIRADLPVSWPLLQLSRAGSCLYAARGLPGLDVVDVTSVDQPARVAAWRPPGGVFGVRVHGAYVYMSTDEGFYRFALDGPCEPVPQSAPFAPAWRPTQWIDAVDDLLVATTTTTFSAARVRDSAAPVELVRVALGTLSGWPDGAFAQGVALADRAHAYVAVGPVGFAVVGLTDPTRPLVLRVVAVPEGLSVTALAASGDLLVVGTSDGVLLYDLRDPRAPALIGAAARGVPVRDLAVDSEDLLVAGDLSGLHLLDVSVPSAVHERAVFHAPYAITRVEAGLEHAYAAGAGLLILSAAETTPTPTQTPTPTASSTRSPTPDATATVVPTSTPDPGVARRLCYLPFTWR